MYMHIICNDIIINLCNIHNICLIYLRRNADYKHTQTPPDISLKL